jgi:ribosomal protein S27AE
MIFARVIADSNQARFSKVSTLQDLESFLKKMNLQRQAVILKPESCSKDEDFIFKGLSSSQQLRDAYLKLKNHFQRETFRIETDNRAHFYEERRSVICQCGLELVVKLRSLCPRCRSPGFSMTSFIKGLSCEVCGMETDPAKEEIWSCPNLACDYQEVKPRKDGLTGLTPAECDWCNP